MMKSDEKKKKYIYIYIYIYKLAGWISRDNWKSGKEEKEKNYDILTFFMEI